MIAGQFRHGKLLSNLISNETSLTETLFSIKVLLHDLNEPKISKWINGELTGYASQKELPEYRKNIMPILYGTIKLDQTIYRNVNIPILMDKMNLLNVGIRDNITSIEKYATSELGSNRLSFPVDARIAASVAAYDSTIPIEIVNAYIPVSSSTFSSVLNAAREIAINILLYLESQYGDIDDLSLDLSLDRDKQHEAAKCIINLIYRGDSIKIGDNNKIIKSQIGDEDDD